MEDTLVEMLNDRNIDDITKHEGYWICKNENVKVLVFFVKEIKVCIKRIKDLQSLVETDVNYVILIYNSNITSFAKQALKNEINCPVQLFTESELSFNITRHVLVPKHEILSAHDKNVFLTTTKYKPQNLPRIYDTEPVIKYFYGKQGDLVRIHRQSETNDVSIYYRMVYNG